MPPRTRRTSSAAAAVARSSCASPGPLAPSEPEHHLCGPEREVRRPSSRARVVLKRQLEQQVPLQRIAAADLHAADRRIPFGARRGTRDLAEAQMVESRREIETRTDLVTALDERGRGPKRKLYRRRAQQGQPPVADDGLEPDEVVVARVLDIRAPGRLRETAVRVLDPGAARRVAGDVRRARA